MVWWTGVCQKTRRGDGSNRWLFLELSDTKITASGCILTSPGLKSNKMIEFIYTLVNASGRIRGVPGHLQTHEMCNEVVQMEPYFLAYVPNHFKMQEMCNKAMCMEPLLLKYVPDHLKIQEMCEKAIKKGLWGLYYVSDHFNTKRMCEKQWPSIHTRWSLSLITLTLKSCVIESLKINKKP